MLLEKTLDKQLNKKEPEPIRFCNKCVMSNQRPRIVFDDDGICSACRYAEMKENLINWDEREKMLLDLLDSS